MWLFAFLFFSFNNEVSLVTQEPLQLHVGAKMSMGSDGSLVAVSRQRLYHWRADGEPIRVIQGRDKPFRYIASYLWDRRGQLYWVIDSSLEAHLFDHQGRYLGTAHWSDGSPVRIRDVFMVGRRLVILEGDQLTDLELSDGDLFRFVTLARGPEGITLTRQGPPFGRFTHCQRLYQYNYKKGWMVQDGFTKRFFFMNQVTPKLQFLNALGSAEPESGLTVSPEKRDLFLRWWVETPRKGLDTGDYGKYSKVTGLYPLGEELLVGYSIPGEEGGNLGLQRFSKEGREQGEAVRMDGFLVGVYDGAAHVLQEDTRRGELHYLLVRHKF